MIGVQHEIGREYESHRVLVFSCQDLWVEPADQSHFDHFREHQFRVGQRQLDHILQDQVPGACVSILLAGENARYFFDQRRR